MSKQVLSECEILHQGEKGELTIERNLDILHILEQMSRDFLIELDRHDSMLVVGKKEAETAVGKWTDKTDR